MSHLPEPPIRVALLQTCSPAADVAAALTTVEAALAAAGAAGATVLVCPETFLPGYNAADITSLATPRGAPWQDRLARACHSTACALVVGYAERAEDGIYNAALALDATGKPLAHYRKIQLYGAREAALYRPGDAYVTFDLGGVKTALLICYDVEFAPHIAALAAMGVQLLLVPTANMLPFTHVMHTTVPAMAANHGVAIVYANYCGAEGDLTYAGGSVIVGPHGEVLAQAGNGPALLIADLPSRDPARLSTQSADFRAIALPAQP
jgi:predicted amidohydrolase